MATLPDLLTFHLPMGKTHQQFGIENPVVKFATDPFVLAGLLGGGLSAASMGRKMAHNKGVRRQLAAGFMPKEAAENTVLKGRALGEALDPDSYNAMGGMAVENTGEPMRMHHGTQTPFGRVNQESVDAVPENLVGPGYYQSSSGPLADEYALGKDPRGPAEGLQRAPNTRMSYVDTRRPFDIEKSYGPDDIPELSELIKPIARRNREEGLEELQYSLKQAIEEADDLEEIRRMTGRASDKDFADWLIEGTGFGNHPLVRAKDTIYPPYWEPAKETQANKFNQALHELDAIAAKHGKDYGMMPTEDFLRDPAFREQLSHVRREARKLGDVAAKASEVNLTPPPVGGQVRGNDLFQELRAAARDLPSVRESHPDDLLDDVVDMSPEAETLANLLQGARPSRYVDSSVGGELEMAREALKRSGFDSITHLGGTNSEVSPHLVNVAWDPEQVYLPYVADEFRSQRPEAAGALLSTLLGGTGVARQSRRRR